VRDILAATGQPIGYHPAVDTSELLRIVRRRRLVALAVAVVVLAAGLLFLSGQRPIYEAKASVALFPNGVRPETLGAYDTVVARLLPLYASVVRSPGFLERVAADLPGRVTGDDLRDRLFAAPASGAAVLDIVVRAPNRGFASSAAQAAVEELQREVADNGVVTLRVIDPGHASETPVAPRPTLVLAASLLLAFVLGVAVAVAWERLFGRIRDLSQLQAIAGQRILGEFPYERSLHDAQRPLFLGDPAARSVEESLRAIRTAIVGPGRAMPTFRRMIVTSLGPEEGKSTLTANLAVVMAEVGPRVLVVDADVRRPRQHRIFELPNDRGVSSLVLGDGDAASATQPTRFPKVSVLTSGPQLHKRSDMAELYVQVIPKLGELDDFVLIDSSALSGDADVGLLAAMTDGVILLVRSGSTSTERLRTALEQLQATAVPVFGLILTMGAGRRSQRRYRRREQPADVVRGWRGWRGRPQLRP
jgi:succinoglycan biosynthesis transport protein ExoP